MKIKFNEITELSIQVLQKYGYSESEEITKSLLWAQKRESSQGFNKLFGWKVEKDNEAQTPTIEKLS